LHGDLIDHRVLTDDFCLELRRKLGELKCRGSLSTAAMAGNRARSDSAMLERSEFARRLAGNQSAPNWRPIDFA